MISSIKLAYYAHPIMWYGTAEEAQDIATIETMGFECVNPSDAEYQESNGRDMGRWVALAISCDVCFFRSCADGQITAGVFRELTACLDAGIPVVELPSGAEDRKLSVDETRARVKAGDL